VSPVLLASSPSPHLMFRFLLFFVLCLVLLCMLRLPEQQQKPPSQSHLVTGAPLQRRCKTPCPALSQCSAPVR
jgi:hypothetical protein